MLRALISEVEASELKKKLGRLDLIKSISDLSSVILLKDQSWEVEVRALMSLSGAQQFFHLITLVTFVHNVWQYGGLSSMS